MLLVLKKAHNPGNPPTLSVGMKIGAVTMKTAWKLLKKLKLVSI